MDKLWKIILILSFVIFIALAFLAFISYFLQRSPKEGIIKGEPKLRQEVVSLSKRLPKIMKLESSVFTNNQFIPREYTCDGENVNPPLKISGVPKEARSLVLIIDDPDAPQKTWVHWIVWNISPSVQEIPANSVPKMAEQGITDFGKPGYGGPCPPSGTHHYFFRLMALDTILSIPPSAQVEELKKAIEGHILDSAELIGLYRR